MVENFEDASVFKAYEEDKTFTIDFGKVNTLEDVIAILKSMGMMVKFNPNTPPQQFIELLEQGIMIQID